MKSANRKCVQEMLPIGDRVARRLNMSNTRLISMNLQRKMRDINGEIEGNL